MKEWIVKRWKLLLIVAIFLGFFLRPPLVLTEIWVNFEDTTYGNGDHWKVFASYREHVDGSSIQKSYERPGKTHITFWDLSYRKGNYVKRMDPIDYHSGGEIRVQDMTFYVNGFCAGKLEGEALLEAFTSNEQVQIYKTETGTMGLVIQGEDSQLIATEKFSEFYSSMARRYARTGILYLIPILAAVIFVVEFYRKKVWKKEDARIFRISNTLLYLVGIAAILLILTGVFVGSSEINPDESEGIYSVNYYVNNWKIPDVRDLDLEAFSKFGTARLTELNLYYIIAAQIARFFTFENGVRLFGLVMIVGLFYLLFANFRKNRYLLCTLFLTPQVWYLYTYCTSDALDFTVGVLVLYQLANPESMLKKLARNGVQKKDWWRVLLVGFVFSNIFMSKQNYYVMAIYAFTILMTELCFTKKEERRKRFFTYLWVAGTALMFLGIRYIPEFIHYGFRKWDIILELQNEIAIPKLRPATPPEQQSSAFNLYGKGVPFGEFLFKKGFHKMLFRSFVGTYGCLEFPSPKWYSGLMGILYLVLYGLVGVSVWNGKKNKERKIKFCLLHVAALVSYGLVLYNGYFIDFQAQGRYMLPVVIFFAHAVSLNPDVEKKKWFQVLICVTAVLSLYSFAVYCIPNIQPA
ncbi:MAG: DUF2142 domain-containing protein [Lachnospiraceae bacterium]|nr:DUF2142 domain-containing protein [Lachnospiraceae bacterium]